MDATSSSTQPPTCPHAEAATKSSLDDDDDNKNKINNNCDSSNTANNNSNRHSSVNGSAGKRTTPQEDSVTTTTNTTTNKANGDAFAMCAHAKTQSISNANEEQQQQVPAPRIVTREVCDHVQFLITEIQKPRDGNEDTMDEARLENEERQRKTTDGTLGEEPDDWPTGM